MWNNKFEVWNTISEGLIWNLCTSETYEASKPNALDMSRLTPITEVSSYVGHHVNGISDLENTKHRYPWICSLRDKTPEKRHLCGVTLLSMPPSKTVLVSSAHCVTVCRSKSRSKVLKNCCCKNVGGDVCANDPECAQDAEVVNMTGDDAEIICGEWETGTTPMSDSGEEYNIILPIKNITRHPDYTISRNEANSQFVANDLAVFFVDDAELNHSRDKIVPICLPSSNHGSPTYGIHSGWSAPPPLEFLEENLPDYVPYHEEFFKQWHYNMTFSKCQDPDRNYKFPSNSYYPSGSICAVEKWSQFCPSSGESGSPLMYSEDDRYIVAGILSFIKGCSVFSYQTLYNPENGEKVDDTGYLNQESLNPSVYLKLSCFLPWIAQQYNMEYEADDIIDPDCTEGNGDINEVTAEVCTTIPSTYFRFGQFPSNDSIEAECIFDFKVDDISWNGCMVSGIESLTHPVFKCPIRTIKNRETPYYYTTYTKSDGLTVNEVVNALYCPTNSEGLIFESAIDDWEYTFNSDGPVFGPNGEYELDPDNDKCKDRFGHLIRLPVFGTCKNNCRGGIAFITYCLMN